MKGGVFAKLIIISLPWFQQVAKGLLAEHNDLANTKRSILLKAVLSADLRCRILS
jgi:hypothetical protein